MVGTAITAAEVRRKEDMAVAPTLLIVAAGLLAASVISRKYTNNIVSAIEGMHSFLAKMVAGRLSNEMPQEILKREDEIGAMGQSIIHMQNAVRILVECDPLTTLYNRRCGDAKMKAVQKKALESGEPFCIAIGDIDFFKKVNDTYGHDAGDLVLKHVASELKNLMAGRGHAVRWGGEEFLLIFEDMRLIPVAASIETFLDKIKAARIKYGSQDIRVTMTMGLVEGKADRSMEEMIKEADEKLYYGKQNGRNQLVVTPGEPEPSYRLLLVEEMDMNRSDMVITFSDDLINSQNLMELFTDNALKGIEKGEDFVAENTKSEEEENDE
jgi:diguanylate cyclase (GGDEF)-like protein